jgi:hypothetical protein
MKYSFHILLTVGVILCACTKDSIQEQIIINRTIIVYMAADNDLSGDALADLEEMQRGYTETGANLVVLADVAGEAPYLLRIDETGGQKIKTYPEFNSTDAAKMKSVLDEIIKMYPSNQYSFVLWSHGTSWLPSGVSLRSFGKDSDREMNIVDLAESLPLKFDFILFDACLMGAVEVAYELKDKTDFIIASSTETIYTGFPYDQIVPELLRPTIDFKRIGKSYFDYYNNLEGAYRSATVSVIETRYLEQLSSRLKALIRENAPDISLLDRSTVQRLDVYEEQYCFDLLDFVQALLPDSEKSKFHEILQQTVIYKAHTPWFLLEYEISAYCGLSCYIPHPQRNDLNSCYKTLGWYEASGIDHLF